MIVSILTFLVYVLSVLLMLYYTFKLLTLYSPPRASIFTREEPATSPSRWMNTFSGKASNLGGAARDLAREAIEDVAKALESLGVDARWVRERRSMPYVVYSVLKTIPGLAGRLGYGRAAGASLKLLRFYIESRRILRLYHIVDVDQGAREKVDRAILHVIGLREKLIEIMNPINSNTG